MTLVLDAALVSQTGAHRRSNQDSVACSARYAFVADGVGGHAGGDVASWLVTHGVISRLPRRTAAPPSHDDLRTTLAVVNWDLGQRAEHDARLAGMATTFTGIFCADRVVTVGHVGDSRAYLARGGTVRQVTRDDSLVQSLVDAGQLTAEQAARHPRRNVILASLGGAACDLDAVSLFDVDAHPGDRWLLASDGLTDYVDPAVVADLLTTAAGPGDAVTALGQAAALADARDNVSLAVADVLDVPLVPHGPPRYAGAAAAARLGPVLELTG